jgi:tetratricopeptide (TPR) repeat protein
LILEGDALFRNKKLVKARQKYQKVLLINPQNGPIRQKVDFITNELSNQKFELLAQADTLLQSEQYEEAKKLLYEALYIDQKDENTLKQLNVCNVALEQQTLSLAEAVVRAVRFDSLGYVNDTQAPTDIAEADPDTTTTNGEKPADIAAVTEETKKPKPTTKPKPKPITTTTTVLPPTRVITPTQKSPYDKLFAEAEAAFDAGDFAKAKAKYKEAMKYGGDKSALEKKISAADKKVASKEYDKHIKSADMAYTNSNYEEAKNIMN